MFSFEKVPRGKFKSKGAIIAERILSDIKSGEYSSGSKLPSERAIAEQILDALRATVLHHVVQRIEPLPLFGRVQVRLPGFLQRWIGRRP